eukprot:CAMPEP_0177425672 /NCGR_PEP_ID=MMETSP0368-20130122/73135_1 /TAXON_ID=447022 ORGANISM="Scrippsiella hangoei-like, Strain SHHI-4" /NCGR_SAMPLE_ID=MMETSP0368 /ASSEMBLY_ACC=CAM_ASM_000363 /LENGTH=90 /DNA_ID=CAMNT_0018895989 /DNA_START=56 /DNA_END=325 /DNA_ORIENTATION=+
MCMRHNSNALEELPHGRSRLHHSGAARTCPATSPAQRWPLCSQDEEDINETNRWGVGATARRQAEAPQALIRLTVSRRQCRSETKQRRTV